MDLGLRDRVYIATGAARGLGRATAEELVKDGAKVVISGRDRSSLDEATRAMGESARAVIADNAAEDTPGRLIQEARQWGRLDGALISVGGPPVGTVESATEEQWRASFETVFLGALRIAKAVAAELGEGGSIAFVLSSSVRAPIGHLAISNGLRPGLAMVAKTMADELGPQGIRVNGLLPGRIETDRIRQMDAVRGSSDGREGIPLRRGGEPAEFGRAAAFLLSPAASYVTGVMLPVDGGAMRAL